MIAAVGVACSAAGCFRWRLLFVRAAKKMVAVQHPTTIAAAPMSTITNTFVAPSSPGFPGLLVGDAAGTDDGAGTGTAVDAGTGTAVGVKAGEDAGGSVGTSDGAGVGTAIGAGTGTAVGMEAGADVGGSMGISDGAGTGTAVGSGTCTAVGEEVGAYFGGSVGKLIGTGVGDRVGAELGDGVGDREGEGVGAEVGAGVGAGVGTMVGANVVYRRTKSLEMFDPTASTCGTRLHAQVTFVDVKLTKRHASLRHLLESKSHHWHCGTTDGQVASTKYVPDREELALHAYCSLPRGHANLSISSEKHGLLIRTNERLYGAFTCRVNKTSPVKDSTEISSP